MIYIHDIDPIIFQLGFFRVMWYGLMYALAFIGGHFWLQWISRRDGSTLDRNQVASLLLYLFFGVLLGGRLGWTLFYGEGLLWNDPLRLFKIWQGGMSFHGGLLGVIAAAFLFGWRNKISAVTVNDFVTPWIPAGLFLGRIGNFINGELYGIPTNGKWGVVFKSDVSKLPRHPTQLYEALLEGLLLFLILNLIALKRPFKGVLSASFLALYGLVRIGIEFIRLPDPQLGYLLGPLTMGMILSIPMTLAGITWLILIWLKSRQAS